MTARGTTTQTVTHTHTVKGTMQDMTTTGVT